MFIIIFSHSFGLSKCMLWPFVMTGDPFMDIKNMRLSENTLLHHCYPHRRRKYPHTQYPTRNPMRSPKPPCKIHLAQTLFSFWKCGQCLPRPCKRPPWDGSSTSNFPGNGRIVERSRWKNLYWEWKITLSQQK